MTIIVFHVHNQIDFNSRLIASAMEHQLTPNAGGTPRPSALMDVAQAVWNTGGYHEVARFEIDDLDGALQNRRGPRATGIGDILVKSTGEIFVVDTFGFAPLLLKASRDQLNCTLRWQSNLQVPAT